MTRWTQPDSHGPIVESLADTLKAALVEFNCNLEEVMDDTRRWSSPLPGSGGENGPRGSDVSDPTGNAATAEHRKEERHTYRLLLSHIETATTSVNDIRRIVERCRPPDTAETKRRYNDTRKLADKLAGCSSVLCEEQAPDGHRHCPECAVWLDKHPGRTQVPRETIQARERQRAKRAKGRIHITGPLAEVMT